MDTLPTDHPYITVTAMLGAAGFVLWFFIRKWLDGVEANQDKILAKLDISNEKIVNISENLRKETELRVKEEAQRISSDMRDLEHEHTRRMDGLQASVNENAQAIIKITGDIKVFRPGDKIDEQNANLQKTIAESIDRAMLKLESMLDKSMNPIDRRLSEVERRQGVIETKVDSIKTTMTSDKSGS